MFFLGNEACLCKGVLGAGKHQVLSNLVAHRHGLLPELPAGCKPSCRRPRLWRTLQGQNRGYKPLAKHPI